jgi:hypothetical protein
METLQENNNSNLVEEPIVFPTYEEMMLEVEKDKHLTGEELEAKYQILSNAWD